MYSHFLPLFFHDFPERHCIYAAFISYQLSVISYQLSVISYQLSVISHQVSASAAIRTEHLSCIKAWLSCGS
ncbi:hypothetical protein CDG79_39165 [Nostoc sp. 'Peltigera membranacea cyanobiont' 232]|nr:hypothetical protein CDG79_39165 [Nostoc sp. 'Peltigera membranacea cyanobiont' 232]